MQKKLNRVPEIVALYWIIKIAATTLGETGADMFSMTYNLGYGTTILLFLVLFLLSAGWKIWLGRYEPVTYWIAFTLSAIAGTAISDYIDRTLGLGYVYGSLFLAGLLGLSLGLWYFKERSLSVERVLTPSAELFYWAAFLIANTLGTAAGDFLADDLGLGFLTSAGLLTVLLVLMVLLHYMTPLSELVLFWLAFVLTRPFGATFGDFLTKPHQQGGLELGTTWASAFFLTVLVFALILAVRQHRAQALETEFNANS